MDGHPGKGPSVLAKGIPNNHRSVFELRRESKRRKTQETSSPRKPGPSGLSKRGFPGKTIDLTKHDVELESHISTVADDSDDSLNLRRYKTHIADDDRATQRLKADHRGGESSNAVDMDEAEAIENFPVPTGETTTVKGKRGMILALVQNVVWNTEKLPAPRSPLNPSNPLNPLPSAYRKPKVRLFTEEEVVS